MVIEPWLDAGPNAEGMDPAVAPFRLMLDHIDATRNARASLLGVDEDQNYHSRNLESEEMQRIATEIPDVLTAEVKGTGRTGNGPGQERRSRRP